MVNKPFCPDPLWDSNLTWFTDNPEFTVCFEQTAFVYVPAAALLILSPFQWQLIRESKDRNVPWSLLNGLRFGLTVLLAILCLVDLGFKVYLLSTSAHLVSVVSSAVKVVTFLFALYIQVKLNYSLSSAIIGIVVIEPELVLAQLLTHFVLLRSSLASSI